MQDYRLNLETFARVDWQQPAKDKHEQLVRAQTNINVQNAASKLQPLFSQILITFMEMEIDTRNAALAKTVPAPAAEVKPKRNALYTSPYSMNKGVE